MTKVAPHEAKITEWLASQQQAMLDLLRDAVNTDSGSYDKAGVDAVGQRFIDFFTAQGLLTTREPHDTFGDAIHIRLDDKPLQRKTRPADGPSRHRVPERRGGPPPVPHRRRPRLRTWRVRHEGRSCHQRVRAGGLQAVRRCAGAARGPHHQRRGDRLAVVAAGDRARRRAQARCVFNSEPGRPSGNVVTGRKGGVFLHFEVFGKAAHSGGNFEKGISAIGELAHKIVAMHALTDLQRGITVNVGLVKGGQSVNTTAPHAEGQIDLRYVKPRASGDGVGRAAGRSSNARPCPAPRPNSRSAANSCPVDATPASEELFAHLSGGGHRCGACGSPASSRADVPNSGFTAAVGCPTLCGVGPVGANAHTPEEYLEVDSFVPRAQALALAILRLPSPA